MKRIFICDSDAAVQARLRAAIERYAQEQQIANTFIAKTPSPKAMLERVTRAREGVFSMVICRIQQEGAFDAVKVLRLSNPSVSIVLVSDRKEDAVRAFEVRANLLLISDDYAAFERAVGEPLSDIAASQTATFALKTSRELRNIPLDDILFAESAKKGPIVHLPNGETIAARGTLQALFNRLVEADSERFVKAGSSFIVNLNNVLSFGKGALIFADGEAIIVPVRVRTPLKESLISYLSA